MREKKRNLLSISLVLCLIAYSLTACKKGEEGKKSPEKGEAAADVKFHDLEGKTVSLSQFKGKVVVLNFWATWCPPCREEMPSMEAMYRKLKGNNSFTLLAVSIDNDMETVKGFMKDNGYTLPAYHDQNQEAGSAYGITGVPETFLIGKNGIIEEKVVGPLDWAKPEVADFIQDLLNK